MSKTIGITLEEAQQLIKKAIFVTEEGKEKPIAIAVVGIDCSLVSFAAMDGVMLASKKLAVNKAYTAIMTDRDTIEWQEKNPPVDVNNFTDKRFTFFGGGILIKRGNSVIGALGISGKGGGKKDDQLAREALNAMLFNQ